MFTENNNFKKDFKELENTTKFKKIKKECLGSYAIVKHLISMSNDIGLFYYPYQLLCEEFALSERQMRRYINILEENELINYDRKNGIVHIVNMILYTNIQLSDKRDSHIKRLKSQINEISNSVEVKKTFIDNYKNMEEYKILFNNFSKNLIEYNTENTTKRIIESYNIATETKNKTLARNTKINRKIITRLITEYNLTSDLLLKYALDNNFFKLYSNIKELLDLIEKDLKVKEIEDKMELPQKEYTKDKQDLPPEDIFIQQQEDNSEETIDKNKQAEELKNFFNII